MRRTTAIFFAILCISNNSVYSQDITEEPLKDCDKNQLTMTFCTRNAYDLSDSELNEIYKKQLASLKTLNEKQTFRNVQRAWIKERDKGCLNEVPVRDGSRTDWQLQYWKCMTTYTQLRVNHLE
ncbi:lysozyme inhibitor LprI family protein [Methyloradius palustris]|uniref:Lysozyme inhibitor LprI-like N-terminal domain-containing protein n=1 Tax=Methyloradius palustris TaxID=2778876 RepID=A0A8D5JWQ8_9PROT|nr:lysozyme inhibitor LprI family protein [Methyloradius palustris]BCM25349.1 hypothetical protein ZMTM_16080 [Methyloradius palustris]